MKIAIVVLFLGLGTLTYIVYDEACSLARLRMKCVQLEEDNTIIAKQLQIVTADHEELRSKYNRLVLALSR